MGAITFHIARWCSALVCPREEIVIILPRFPGEVAQPGEIASTECEEGPLHTGALRLRNRDGIVIEEREGRRALRRREIVRHHCEDGRFVFRALTAKHGQENDEEYDEHDEHEQDDERAEEILHWCIAAHLPDDHERERRDEPDAEDGDEREEPALGTRQRSPSYCVCVVHFVRHTGSSRCKYTDAIEYCDEGMPMRVYLSVDVEGVAGIVDWDHV